MKKLLGDCDMHLIDVEERLDRLERHNRALRCVIAVLTATLAAAFILGFAREPARVIEAQEFRLVDPSGGVRAKCAHNPANDSVSFSLLDDRGKERVIISANSGLARLSLADSTGVSRAEIRADALGTTFGLMDRRSQARVRFGIADGPLPGDAEFPDPGPVAHLLDQQGRKIWSALP